jgi:hypothetical protein
MNKLLLMFVLPGKVFAQLSFFNMPNPDMLPQVGYSYIEYDRYQSVKGETEPNASVVRLSVQAAPFLEVGTNVWFNSDHPSDPNRLVLATKWKLTVHKQYLDNHHMHVSISPGSWTSLYFTENPVKNILYTFAGVTFDHPDATYTRFMLGGYWKFFGVFENSSGGLIAGFEHKLNNRLEFVTDYFQGSGEGFGLATGFVFYALDNGKNLPVYLAYQFDNDSRQNDVLLFQIGYIFRIFRGEGAASGSRLFRTMPPGW